VEDQVWLIIIVGVTYLGFAFGIIYIKNKLPKITNMAKLIFIPVLLSFVIGLIMLVVSIGDIVLFAR